ncbi:MAG: PEP-CTERM sorting domain-containing protein [Myxococcota bacterium]
MRKNVILGFVTAALVVFGASSASALALNATIGGIFTDSSLSTAVAGVVIDGDGNATATLAAGQAVLVNINVDNNSAEAIEAIFATLTIQGDQTNFLGPNAPGSILEEAGFGGGSLANIGTGMVKVNTPNAPGAAADVWIQALAYGTAGGVDGSGDTTADISLLFIVSGASGGDLVEFLLGVTSGDAITAPGGAGVATTFSGATINVPEPGTALLMGLGLLGLAGAGRRRS